MVTFKEYLDSKQQMVELLQQTPTATIRYIPTKYGSLRIDETMVGIKCSQLIEVEWQWNDDNTAVITECRVFDKHGTLVASGAPQLTNDRMRSWLDRNTIVQ